MRVESALTADTQAVLLLCGELGHRGSNGVKPLGLRQYNALAAWLRTEGLRPGDLLTAEGQHRLGKLQTAEVNRERVCPLLERGAALALVFERWDRSGLWVISRSDAQYSERLKKYLGLAAPPLLYGVGSKEILNRGGLAVVGSRDRSDEDGEFAQRVGECCAREGIAVISGAAKGIDRDAMTGALDAGGWALGVLAEGLARTATSGQYRAGLLSDHLTLVSPFDPDSRWFAYTAMERNKLLYGLSDAALVVASSADSGGTWAGATGALQHGRVRVFVKSTGVVAPGNHKLLRIGGIPFPEEPWTELGRLFIPPEVRHESLFAPASPTVAEPAHEDASRMLKKGASHPISREIATGNHELTGAKLVSVPVFQHPASESPAATSVDPEAPQASAEQKQPEDLGAHSRAEPKCDAYSLVKEAMLSLLAEPRTEDWLAERMCVRAPQMRGWLDRGVREGSIIKLKKPVRYVVYAQPLLDVANGPQSS